MKSNSYAMKDWHVEHVEKVIIRFIRGMSTDATSYEKRLNKKYGTLAHCMNQIEYDMHQGVDKKEVMQFLHKIRFNKKYAGLRSDAQAIGRLVDLEEKLSGTRNEERLLWHDKAYKEKIAVRRTHTSHSMSA
jgi:hypothetical protein